ncbi:hypothetical protein LZ30DRAFT_398454 [Colletotrichum cereale]|nr:hypothetical protein LZ30DRAFT_398454 [Colletotrichum cereale]
MAWLYRTIAKPCMIVGGGPARRADGRDASDSERGEETEAASAPPPTDRMPRHPPPSSLIGRRRFAARRRKVSPGRARYRRPRTAHTIPPSPSLSLSLSLSLSDVAPLSASHRSTGPAATRSRCAALPSLPDAAVRYENDREAQASALLLKRAVCAGKGKRYDGRGGGVSAADSHRNSLCPATTRRSTFFISPTGPEGLTQHERRRTEIERPQPNRAANPLRNQAPPSSPPPVEAFGSKANKRRARRLEVTADALALPTFFFFHNRHLPSSPRKTLTVPSRPIPRVFVAQRDRLWRPCPQHPRQRTHALKHPRVPAGGLRRQSMGLPSRRPAKHASFGGLRTQRDCVAGTAAAAAIDGKPTGPLISARRPRDEPPPPPKKTCLGGGIPCTDSNTRNPAPASERLSE